MNLNEENGPGGIKGFRIFSFRQREWVAVNLMPEPTLEHVKVGKEIRSRTNVTSKFIRAATVSRTTGAFSAPKTATVLALVAALVCAPLQLTWSFAQAAPQYDSVQIAQMWAMVKAIEEGRDTDPVHIAQAQEFLASQGSASPAPAPVASAAATAPAGIIEIWWPTAGAVVEGVQPLKAVVQGREVSSYSMEWRVGDVVRAMPTSMVDHPHKEDGSVDVSAWGGGARIITLTAKDAAGVVIATRDVPVTVRAAAAPPSQPTALQAPVPAPAAGTQGGSNPLMGLTLYVNKHTSAASQASQWRASRPGDAQRMDVLATQPTAQWFGGWSGDIQSAVERTISAARAQGQAPVLVAYNIPQRDCGGYSAGGTNDYQNWIGGFARGIGSNSAVVILEPDALAGITCLSDGDQRKRLELLSSAVSILKSNPNTKVYVDAGHSGWIAPDVMAARLQAANIAKADGFATNVSNFMATADETSYGTRLSEKLGGKHFVVDTARNGAGSNGEWCNPWGRAIGQKPTVSTGNHLIDAYLWVKTPGESDGNCNGGPSAGSWWPDYALHLVR